MVEAAGAVKAAEDAAGKNKKPAKKAAPGILLRKTTKTKTKKKTTKAKKETNTKTTTEKSKKASLGETEASPMKGGLGVNSSLSSEDVPGCTDPATADVEAFECECLEELKAKCAVDGLSDIEACFSSHMCSHADVCDSWKMEHCPGGGTLLMRRSSIAQKASGALDGSVTGKCTSEAE